MKLTDAFGLPPALRHATTPLQPGLEELEAHMESTTTLNPGIQGPVSKRDGAEDRRRRLGQLWQVLLLQRLGAPHQKV